jgi:hypothetical protein
MHHQKSSSSSRRHRGSANGHHNHANANANANMNGHHTSPIIRAPPTVAAPPPPLPVAPIPPPRAASSSSIETMSPGPSPPSSPAANTRTVARAPPSSYNSPPNGHGVDGVSTSFSSNSLQAMIADATAPSPHPSLMYASTNHRAPASLHSPPSISMTIPNNNSPPTLAGIASPPPKGQVVTAQPVVERRTRGGWVRMGDCIELHDEKRERCISTGEVIHPLIEHLIINALYFWGMI